MREEIYQFTPSEFSPRPFEVELAGISYCDGTYHIVRNHSSILCMEYIIAGSGTIETPEGIFHPSAGDTYLLHQGEYHNYYSDKKNPWTKIWMNCYGDLVSNLLSSYDLLHTHYLPKTPTESFFRDILTIAQTVPGSQAADSICLIFHKFLQFIYMKNRQMSLTPLPSTVSFMKHYLDEHFREQIRIDDLAHQVYLSHSQVIRLFRCYLGTTPIEYVENRRIEYAKIMLKNTRLPIREIAEQSGFSDEHYFSGYFKKKTGISPRTYRS